MTDAGAGGGGRRVDFEALLEQHLPRLRAFIRLRTNRAIRSRESHTDLVQSVCREVLQGADAFEYRGDAAFRKWLYTAALRKIVERDRSWRAQKRDVRREQAAPETPSSTDGDLFDAYATVSTPSVVLSRKENAAALEAAFDQLSEEHREVVTLAKVVGLSHAEIAEQTGRSEEASRQILRRALIKLQLALDSER